MLNFKNIFDDVMKHIKLNESKLKEARGQSKLDVSSIDSPRQALTKIHQLTGSKLTKFLTDFKDNLDKASFVIKITPKIDGHPYRLAWIDGKTYCETSYSGLMGPEELEVQKVPAFEKRFFEYINKKDNHPLMNFLKKFNLSGIKVLGELLPNGSDIADENGTITYVGTTYDAEKLGSIGSVVIIDIKGATLDDLTDLDNKTKSKIADFLASDFSDKNASFFDINKFAQNIDINKSDFDEEFIKKLYSEKISKMTVEDREILKMEINTHLTEIFKDKFKNPSLMKNDDKSLEGVAFELNGQLYGIHYQSWKDIRTSYYKEIDEAKDYVKAFLAKLVGKSIDSPISKIIEELQSNFDKYQKQYKVVWKEWLKRKDKLVNKLKNATNLPKFIQSAARYRAENLEEKFNNANVTDDLNSVLCMVYKEPVDEKGKTICILPGSFRPPHKGHLALIEHYSKIADEVYVVVSGQTTVSSRRPDKFGRTMPNYVAGQILKIYCDAYDLTNVNIRMAMRLMAWVKTKILSMKNVKIILGVSGKDDESRFSMFTNEKFAKAHPDIKILPIKDTQFDALKSSNGKEISATEIRDNIDNDEFLKTILPNRLSKEQVKQVLELMNPPSGKYPPMTNKTIADKLFAQESEQMQESGNMFDDCTRINQENVAATLDDVYKKVLPLLKVDKKDTAVLGSTGKKKPGSSSGDIDLAIDFAKSKYSSLDDFFAAAEKTAKKLGVESHIIKGIALCSYRWPISNIDGKQPNLFVQLDLMPTDHLEMMKWGMYSPSEEEYSFKGACRNQLLSAITRHKKAKVLSTYIDENGEKLPLEYERYSFSPNKGLSKGNYSKKGKKEGKILKNPKKISSTFISADPDEIAKILFGASTKAEDLLTCDDVWNKFKKMDMFKNEKIRDQVIADTINELNKAKIKYPSYLYQTLKNKALVKKINTINEAEDTKNRVAVIITDGTSTIVGKSPQNLRKTENCCDLFKGHVQIDESFEQAAKREVYEESGMKLEKIEQISNKLKYLSGTTLTFFKAYLDKLPDVSILKCKSFYEYNGKQYPEIAQYLQIKNDELPKYLYKGLAKMILDNDLLGKLSNTNDESKQSQMKKSKQIDESVESVFEEDSVCIETDITDDLLKNAKIACYDSNVVLKDEDGKAVPVNPKKFPDRAVNICIDVNGVPVYIFFDAKKKCWDSSFKMNDDSDGALSPNQFGQFFNTKFCNKLFAKLQKIWPLTDPYHAELYNAAIQKQHALGCPCTVDEAADDKEDEEKEKFSATGRKIMKFNDSGVSSKGAKFFCWPNTEKLYRWSTWKDWKKIRPLCRMRFKYNNGHWYGISLSVIGDDYKNRGFRSFDLTQQPPLQWLSKNENEDLMKLSLFDKFIRHCVEKIQKYVNLDPEEIYSKINNPEKITVDEIRLTQQKIRNTLNQIIKNKQSDSFKWF